ncbi:geranylgeranylglycerol-phosphate geranylgeranyltransferase [Flavobacterium sp. HJJ]|uniref:geranylgeranylglycerol-phosphate geranylgeranyltransferase n=1 Tax=Flavobacterium sp. HJJ TaxID=2783792 RepID=UPI00188B0AAB|nr:geranylgeranylglycerol-phosphate geranylgeranyltransferase [Flavobacterium sp. HJJ]MBF4472588.1 geranylgeranylglycerol-phosphate geranylgeranyltransferase [Flavobacterium sp. HJJ]
MKYLKLIRFQNLLMLALMQLLFRYGFLNFQNITLALTDWQYLLLVLATVMIAAGGYVINNIMDQATDNYNKPKKVVVGKSISEASAYNIYFFVTVLGVGIGFYLSNVIAKPGFASIFIIISATLYLYATSLKQMLLIGNFVVAFLLAFSVIIIGVFDLLPVINPENKIEMAELFSILMDYAVFAFVINFIREIVKDMEDISGDHKQGMNTLPVILGLKRTSKIVFVLSLIPLIMITYYIKNYFLPNDLHLATLYSLTCIVSPLIYFTIKIDHAKKKKDYHQLSTILKLIILFGCFSIAVVTYNILHHHHA